MPAIPEDACRQEQDAANQRERGGHGNSDQAERQCQQPDDRREHEHQQRERPSQHKQNAPDEEHGEKAHAPPDYVEERLVRVVGRGYIVPAKL